MQELKMPPKPDAPAVLLAEDDRVARRLYRRILECEGYHVVAVPDGQVAVAMLQSGQQFDVILADIRMPGVNGVDLLRHIRDEDLGVPVVLMTAGPSLETAIKGVELNAFHYLTKPFDHDALTHIIQRALLVSRDHKAEQNGRTQLMNALHGALDASWVAFQPIVNGMTARIYGHEGLLRTRSQILTTPLDILQAATILGQVESLGARSRATVVDRFVGNEVDGRLFVNLHPNELTGEDLYDPRAPLSVHADRVILELSERVELPPVDDLIPRLQRLRRMGFRIALDDFGSGHAGLSNMAALRPEFIKLTRVMISQIDRDSYKQRIVKSLVSMANDLEVKVIGVGVETGGECQTLLDLGIQLLQGFWVARPSETPVRRTQLRLVTEEDS